MRRGYGHPNRRVTTQIHMRKTAQTSDMIDPYVSRSPCLTQSLDVVVVEREKHHSFMYVHIRDTHMFCMRAA